MGAASGPVEPAFGNSVTNNLDHGTTQPNGDVTALLQAGILDQAEAGVAFPYEAVHVDFTLTKAA